MSGTIAIWDRVEVTLPNGNQLIGEVTGRWGESWIIKTDDIQRNSDGSYGLFYTVPGTLTMRRLDDGIPSDIQAAGSDGSLQLPAPELPEGPRTVDRYRTPTYTTRTATELRRLLDSPGIRSKASVLRRKQARQGGEA